MTRRTRKQASRAEGRAGSTPALRSRSEREAVLTRFRQAVARMAQGQFDAELPEEGAGGELDALGQALTELGRSLTRRFDELERLNELTERLHATVRFEEALDFLFEALRPLIPFDRMGCALVRGGGAERYRVEAAWARTLGTVVKIGRGYSAELAGSSLERLLATGEPRILEDLEEYLRTHPESASTRDMIEEGVRSSLTCPLRSRGRALGFLFFSSFRPYAYKRRHIAFCLFIAGHVSTLIEKAELYEQLMAARAELEEANARLARLASVDALTGIANRRGFDQQLRQAWRLAQRKRLPVALLMMDLDGLKPLNDRQGHLAGDAWLRRVAEVLENALLRHSDFAARYGGDEFAILLPGTDREGAAAVADRLRREIAAAASANGIEGGTVSIGVAAYQPRREDRAETLIAAADAALYAAKAAGGNRWIANDPLLDRVPDVAD